MTSRNTGRRRGGLSPAVIGEQELTADGHAITLVERHIRCGRSGCHCAESEGHGPYYSLVWRENGRVRTRYLRKAEIRHEG